LVNGVYDLVAGAQGFGNWINSDLVAGLDIIMPGRRPHTKNKYK
jgi:hypothetical protein